MIRRLMWWRPIARKPSRAELQRDIVRLEELRAELARDLNHQAGETAAARSAADRKEAALEVALQAGQDLGERVAEARRILSGAGHATDRIAGALRVLAEGGAHG